MKWIKKQLSRCVNMIKAYWNFLVFDMIDDFNDMFTPFGRVFVIILMCIIAFAWTLILIPFMPLMLAVMKYDKHIGF